MSAEEGKPTPSGGGTTKSKTDDDGKSKKTADTTTRYQTRRHRSRSRRLAGTAPGMSVQAHKAVGTMRKGQRPQHLRRAKAGSQAACFRLGICKRRDLRPPRHPRLDRSSSTTARLHTVPSLLHLFNRMIRHKDSRPSPVNRPVPGIPNRLLASMSSHSTCKPSNRPVAPRTRSSRPRWPSPRKRCRTSRKRSA